ncbi:UNVERIFIED_CONTAM: Sulfoquinovosyl transferase sqd2 [Siphonaria sp. JEL0065]|nr:Sulfoquinovosyl transferase sqd2 [Siphonaria sp. JEL0065]
MISSKDKDQEDEVFDLDGRLSSVSPAAAGTQTGGKPLRILMATEYLPPFVSGIANRCKNLVKGYREHGHHVTVYGPPGSDCDIQVVSIVNPFYDQQRLFFLPPFLLILQLLNPFQEVQYDIAHIVAPMAAPFLFVLPLLRLRGVKIYVSYHVLLEFYKQKYFNELLGMFLEGLFIVLYFIPLVYFADVVGIPSKTADSCVYKYSKRIHYMRSGLDTTVFKPVPEHHFPAEDDYLHPTAPPAPLPIPSSLKPFESDPHPSTPMTRRQTSLVHKLHTQTSTKTVAPVLVYVGRLAVEKNVEFLIRALDHPCLATAKLVIVGDGPARPSLEAAARETVGPSKVYSAPLDSSHIDVSKGSVAAHPAARVLFAGMVHNEQLISTYYANADVFVSASASETFGFTVAEAMACGTPSVMVRSGAFRSVYRMIDGWMFEDMDTEDYAGRVGRVVADGILARRVARRVAVRQFGVMGAVKDLLKTYEMCVQGVFWEEEGLKKGGADTALAAAALATAGAKPNVSPSHAAVDKKTN